MKAVKVGLSETKLLEEVIERLDRLIIVIAIQGRLKEEQIKYLAGLDYSNSEIANMLAIPKGTIDRIRASLGKGGSEK